MKRVICRLKPYIQPFELQLALDELAALAQARPQQIYSPSQDNLFEVLTPEAAELFANRLAYWETITDASGEALYTRQILHEATISMVHNGITIDQIASIIPFRNHPPLPKKRCLRYGPHGIHEYRGKFFPQLVRSLINAERIPAGSIVADPMAGSGTTVVESIQLGCHGLGLDMNPLSVFLANTKSALLTSDPNELARSYHTVRALLYGPRPYDEENRLRYFSSLPIDDQEYLSEWLPEISILELDRVSRSIETIDHTPSRNLMWMALSNIIRRVSWQKLDDLRVRRDTNIDIDSIDPVGEFLRELDRSVKVVFAFLCQSKDVQRGRFLVQEGDARNASHYWYPYSEKVDLVITSPPYATALPYLDTDRLSLCWLGLLSRPEHRHRDQVMIGNREITDRTRQSYWQNYVEYKSQLPQSTGNLIDELDFLNSTNPVGFRRRNLPALLAKYFLDMRSVLSEIRRLLRPKASAYVVVGNNHTMAAGKRIDIQTADMLGEIAVSVGMEYVSSLSMEMLTSRDIFRKNAMNSEIILHLRRPAPQQESTLQLQTAHMSV